MQYTYITCRPVFANPKSIQASVTLIEKLPVILDKSTEEDLRHLVLPLLFNSLESKMCQIQVFTNTMYYIKYILHRYSGGTNALGSVFL